MHKIVLTMAACGASLLMGPVAQAQGQVVRGVVSDGKLLLPGVTVIEKGTPANGASTDAEGRYQLTLRGKTGVLVFSFIGYESKEVPVGGQTAINVSLRSSEQKLNEVMVVGFGEQKKITSTGSASSVSGREIRENPTASLQNSIVGRMPGFFSQQTSGRPGQDGAAFYIRGQSSYNGNNQPLIIVDDIEYTYEQFSRLDPNEIESLTILKDASTTAIYGVRGANGVMVVTTRRGQSGPPKVSVRLESANQQPTTLPKYLDAYQSASLYTQAQINDNAANPNPNFKPRFSEEDLRLFKTGEDPYGHPNVNWRKVLFREFSQQYRANLDLSGGTDRVKYFVSAGYLYQNGLLKDFGKGQGVNNNFFHQRYNYRSNLDISVTKSTDVRVDLYGNFAQTNDPVFANIQGKQDIFYEYSSFLALSPFAYPIYNPDGSYGFSQWQIDQTGYNANNVVGRLTNYGYSRTNSNNINGIVSVKQKLDFLTKGLQVTGRVAYTSDYAYGRGMNRSEFPSFIYDPTKPEDDPTAYRPRDPNVYRVRRFFLSYGAGSTRRVLNVQGILNYDRTFGKHHVTGLGLLNRNSVSVASGDVVYNYIPNNFRGYSGRFGYDYAQKYLLQLNAGYNGSTRFTKNNRYGVFPAISGGWVLSEEGFYKNHIKAVDFLKFRGSYGIVGNDALGSGFSYYYQQTYNTAGGVNLGYSSNNYGGIEEGRLANENVTWEKERKLDVAVEFGLFNSAVTGNVNYFNNERYDILTNRGTISAIFGQALPPVNLGRVNNRGIEYELAFKKQLTADWMVGVHGQYSIAKNKVLFRDEPQQQYEYQRFTGKSIGQELLYESIGFYRDQQDIDSSPTTPVPARPGDLKYKDLNGDGVINEFDRAVVGLPNLPTNVYGFDFNVRYKGITLSALFQGVHGGSTRLIREGIKAFASNLTEVHTKAWTPELGDAAQYPRLTLLAGLSDADVYSSTFWQIPNDFLRMRNAQINWDLPASFTQRLGIPQMRVYANGSNLLTFTQLTKRYEVDPEISLGNDRVAYPPQRVLNLGVSATF
ncbi:SusC/RagA family TonB-linked outer membrane protein [Hymenobacter norwichensis]|uniref:SusC/RagA family TonB-linked outer membrane protein n=1 Tax=Hymenobacter norwichensis TaxID=223903 RepID=UPI00041B7FA1|nr:TonB-dependent receptor [Hymenobacter norwichensis]